MAQKRMFDRAIIDTDRFMDLSMSSKALYFLLGMEADDEGFVSYKKVMRIHGGNEDDVKVLLAKNFIIGFDSGVVVITDWNSNNWLDTRRIKPTEYKKEKSLLSLTEQKKYVLSIGLTSIVESRVVESSIEEIVAKRDEKVFNFEEELTKLKDGTRKDFKIIALYWKKKGWVFRNKSQLSAALKRELRAAKSLDGYTGEEIARSINFCAKEYPEVWTLETVFKRIQDLVNTKKT